MSTNSNKAPGRNDSCPCGSGAKFKNCCLPKLERQDQAQQLTPIVGVQFKQMLNHFANNLPANALAHLAAAAYAMLDWSTKMKIMGPQPSKYFDPATPNVTDMLGHLGGDEANELALQLHRAGLRVQNCLTDAQTIMQLKAQATAARPGGPRIVQP